MRNKNIIIKTPISSQQAAGPPYLEVYLLFEHKKERDRKKESRRGKKTVPNMPVSVTNE